MYMQNSDFWRYLSCRKKYYSTQTYPILIYFKKEISGTLQTELYSPSLSEALAEWILSERSGTFSKVARSSLCTTIFNLPLDLSINVFASVSDIFSVTVPFIFKTTSPSWMLPSLAAKLSCEISFTNIWLANRRPYSRRIQINIFSSKS